MESPLIKYGKAFINLAIGAGVLALAILLLPRLLLFFAPFVTGWVIALIAAPLVQFLEKKVKIKRKAGSAFVIIVVIGLVVLVLYLVGSRLWAELKNFILELPDMWEQTQERLAEIGRNLGVVYGRFPKDLQNTIQDAVEQASASLGEWFGGIGSPTLISVGNFAKQLPSMLIGVIMCLLSAYFFVADRGAVYGWFRRYTPKSLRSSWLIIKNSLVKAVGGYLKAQLKIEIWMYILLVIGLSVLRVEYALLIALGIAALDFIPFFGTGTVLVPWAVMSILGTDYKMAVGLLIIWGGGQLARQIIQPKIMGDSIGVPPIPTLFLLYIGYKLSGVLGMILAVPLGLIAYTLFREGVFDTTKNSVLLLAAGLNRFRRLNSRDIDVLKDTAAERTEKKP